MCEMVFTSDKAFFNKIGEKNIISAVAHLDEETPHMHLVYIPAIHTKEKWK